MCGLRAPAEVVQLLQHLPSVEPYPHRVLRIPDASAGRPVLPGVAFFPGGTGLWMPDFQTQPEVFPVGEVMVIGQDFDSEASYHATLNLMGQGPCDPRTRNPATWGRLLKFLPRCAIAAERCFFTNFFMGLRQGKKAVGVFPGAADMAFEERCRQFVGQQLETQQARLVLTLGIQVPPRLAPLAQQLSHWQGVESFTRLDAVGPVVHNVEFPGVRSTCSVVALLHPCFRPSNLGRRKYGRFQGDEAEVEMVREALMRCGMTGSLSNGSSDSPSREPIVAVNKALRGGDAAEAVAVFRSLLRGEYSYCFADAEPFVRDTVMEVFQGLIALTTEFQVFRGPRKRQGSTWHHPTYAISFNTLKERHFCDFKPKVVAGGYFKMTFPLPCPGFFDSLLQGCQWTQRDQSSGSFVDVRLFADTPKERCEQLADVADRVRRYYV